MGEAWAFRRSARSSKGGHYDEDADVSSDLTYGAEEVYCGNLARGLRRRNVTQAAEKYESKESVFERLSCDEILAELRKSSPTPLALFASLCLSVSVSVSVSSSVYFPHPLSAGMCCNLSSTIEMLYASVDSALTTHVGMCRWKDETINLALRPEDEDEPKEYKVHLRVCALRKYVVYYQR